MIIILGDFSQLPPVQSSTLPYATMQVVSLSKQQEDTLTTSSLLPATRPHNKPARKKDQGFLLRARKHHETVRKTKSIKDLSQYSEFQVGKPKRHTADFFMALGVYQLTKQQRTKDPQHMKRSKKMS